MVHSATNCDINQTYHGTISNYTQTGQPDAEPITMNNSGETSNVAFAGGEGASFLVRWRGRQEGPYSAELIEKKLAANEIGLLHEILHDGQWITIRDYLAEREATIRAQQQAREEQERREREEADRQAREMEAQQRAAALAEEKRRNDLVELAARRSPHQEDYSTSSPHGAAQKGSSSLRNFGAFLIIAGLAVAAYFWLAFDPSVESGAGRIVNLGLMADRQNGIIVGIGLGIVGAITLALGSRGRT